MREIQRPFIIDVEASGFGFDSYPIEVGVALDFDQRYCALITPPSQWTHWDGDAESVHNISRDMLQHKGKSVHEVAEKLNEMLADKYLFSDGWVVDEPWIIKLFFVAGLKQKFRIYDIQTLLNEKQMKIWHETKLLVEEELGVDRHRASNDAWVVQETYLRTKEQSLR